jgi:hypothetical protein
MNRNHIKYHQQQNHNAKYSRGDAQDEERQQNHGNARQQNDREFVVGQRVRNDFKRSKGFPVHFYFIEKARE